MGPPGLHPADEGWLAADRGRLRGRDLPGRLQALTSLRLIAGVAAACLLLAAAAAPAADLEAGRRKAQVCAGCHGPDGNATIPGTPSLAGQPVYFTHWQLIKYRDGRRKDPQMSPLAEKLDDADMADLAAFYAAQPPRARPASPDAARVAAGRRLAETHHCTSCHRPGLTGQQQAARLAGQDFDYLLRLLRGFKAKTAADLDGTMTVAAQPLQDDEIVSLVHFLVSLTPEAGR
ncbi:MAG TPA: c-type cytochrome [Methylomirabilota bacterium]|nr:c-type cytochrome [Methylomirabilota bacterium]